MMIDDTVARKIRRLVLLEKRTKGLYRRALESGNTRLAFKAADVLGAISGRWWGYTGAVVSAASSPFACKPR